MMYLVFDGVLDSHFINTMRAEREHNSLYAC